MTIPARLSLAAAAVLLAIVAGACSGTSSSTTPPATQGLAAASATIAPDAGAATAKVSANNASADELAAALESVGVQNASRWVREIQEYRPYPTDDPTLQKLQDNLAKYNPDAATLARLLSVLEP